MNSERLTFALSKELKEEIYEMAKKNNIPVNSLIRFVLTDYVRKNK